MAIVLLVFLSFVAFQALSGARAYVHGESQWTKAQKLAVISLFEFAITGDRARYDAHSEALEVNRGDRRARMALEQDEPDIEAAREGFLAGRNHPDDIDQMIRLFVYGRDYPPFARAVDVWRQGDELIAQLSARAETLKQVVADSGPNSAPVLRELEALVALDQRLTRLEDEFSRLMGRISHEMAILFSLAIAITALLLILGGSLLAWRLLYNAQETEDALRESEQRYRALVDQPEVGMWQVDPEGGITYLNPAMRMLLGIGREEEIRGLPIEQFIADQDRAGVIEKRKAREAGANTTMEVELVPRRGKSRKALVHGAPVLVGGTRIAGHVGTCVDITDRKAAEEELRYQAFHDPLTGLPNRQLFMDRLTMALRRARRNRYTVAVLFVDLDRFKVVNDGLGHAAGDRLLREAATRLQDVCRERDSIARFGGDEFGVIIEEIAHENDATVPAQRIVNAFQKEFHFDEVSARVGASVGIALSTGGAERPADLLRFADIAMYVAKRQGGRNWHIYDPGHDSLEEQRLHMESRLWNAADRNELVVMYQPIMDLNSRRTVAVEALVRWNHPQEGLLGPASFISIAEDTGAIEPIGRWVTRQACLDIQRLHEELADAAPESVAINISDAEFRLGDPAASIEEIRGQIGIQASALHFEVTESLLTRQPQAIRTLEQLGYAVSIDDFGTGYASLDRLREVNFSAIKLDRSFIAGLNRNSADRAVVEAVIHLGQRLGMQIIAEGIEEPEQLSALLDLGCEHGQGYLFARPMPLDDLFAYLQNAGGKRK